jgi:predicted metal-binding membrane protein
MKAVTIRMPRSGVAALVAVVMVAWLGVVAGADRMGRGVVPFVGAWTVMMTAMMLPSAAPLILLYRRTASAQATAVLAAGYLAVWSVVGFAAYAVAVRVHGAAEAIHGMGGHDMAARSERAVAAVLVAAGIYQLTPLKAACLRRCRSPADFLVQHWRHHAFAIGGEHGLWCLGCCWALMVVLVVAGVMGLAWVLALTAVIAVEKLAPAGDHLARLTGAGLVALAVWELWR